MRRVTRAAARPARVRFFLPWRAASLDALHRRSLMIRKLKSGEYRLYSRKKNPKTGKRRNLGTFKTREQAERHERAVQFFKRH
jgi:hypothetical protein